MTNNGVPAAAVAAMPRQQLAPTTWPDDITVLQMLLALGQCYLLYFVYCILQKICYYFATHFYFFIGLILVGIIIAHHFKLT